MESLNDERAAVVEKGRRPINDTLDRLLADEREVGDGGIYADIDLAGRDAFVGRDAEFPAARCSGLLDERWDCRSAPPTAMSVLPWCFSAHRKPGPQT